jgi:GNAT superfamily N-acetyltransferase
MDQPATRDEVVATTRLATPADADAIARMLYDFNTEFDVASPPVEVLAARLRDLLAGDDTFAILSGDPPAGLALVTVRPNVWYAGPVALLDEMYVVPDQRDRGIGSAVIEHLLAIARERGFGLVEINVDEGDVDAQRFYVHHGFSGTEEGSTERALYFFQELGDAARPTP